MDEPISSKLDERTVVRWTVPETVSCDSQVEIAVLMPSAFAVMSVNGTYVATWFSYATRGSGSEYQPSRRRLAIRFR